jgi:hypothetical protein
VKAQLYLMGDGDDIREHIEFYLLNSDLNALTNFSKNLAKAINVIMELAVSRMDAEVIYAGGDEIFFRIDKDCYNRIFIEDMISIFQKNNK